MKARDIMTVDVVTASPDDSVQSLVDAMLNYRISAIPIVDGDGRVLGMVSEGDLLNRPEAETTHESRSWWLRLLTGPAEQANDFLKVYGNRARDVMTTSPITVDSQVFGVEALRLMEQRRITSVVVVDRDGRLRGVVHLHDLWQTKMV